MTRPPDPNAALATAGTMPPPPPMFGRETGAAGQAKQKQNRGGFGSTILGAGNVSGEFTAGQGQRTLLGQ